MTKGVIGGVLFAAGMPVIGSKLGGIVEWVRHQENGLLRIRRPLQRAPILFADLPRIRSAGTFTSGMADVASEMVHCIETI